MPVMVLKHCKRKFSVSSTSSPEEGSARFDMPLAPGAGATGFMGLSLDVMAWTLEDGRIREQRGWYQGCSWAGGAEEPGPAWLRCTNVPVKSTSEDEVVVRADLVEAALVERLVVD